MDPSLEAEEEHAEEESPLGEVAWTSERRGPREEEGAASCDDANEDGEGHRGGCTLKIAGCRLGTRTAHTKSLLHYPTRRRVRGRGLQRKEVAG
jgi:hypothetical protein